MYCMSIVREAFAQFYYFFDIQNSKILHKTDISIPTHSLYHRTASEKVGVSGGDGKRFNPRSDLSH